MFVEYIICRLQHIDRIFGNENFLREIEEDIFDIAANKVHVFHIKCLLNLNN